MLVTNSAVSLERTTSSLRICELLCNFATTLQFWNSPETSKSFGRLSERIEHLITGDRFDLEICSLRFPILVGNETIENRSIRSSA